MTHLGLQIPSFPTSAGRDTLFETVSGIARAAEDAGFDSVWVMDHFHQLPPLGGADEPILEAYTTLAALAARTERIQLGALVTGVMYRNPALLAKMVTTIDVISRGRAVLGIGAAWFGDEHEAYGYGPLPPGPQRLERLEEAVQICRLMFTEERPTFEGRHYSVHDARNVPRPVRPGGPPILIGGSGEKVTLRLVARHADLGNVFGGPDTIRRKTEALQRHCGDIGRDPAEITRTALSTLVIAPTEEEAEEKRAATLAAMGVSKEQAVEFAVFGDPGQVTEQMEERRDAGLDGMIVNLAGDDATEPELVALAAEALRAAFV